MPCILQENPHLSQSATPNVTINVMRYLAKTFLIIAQDVLHVNLKFI